jgi:hypothetical protein
LRSGGSLTALDYRSHWPHMLDDAADRELLTLLIVFAF